MVAYFETEVIVYFMEMVCLSSYNFTYIKLLTIKLVEITMKQGALYLHGMIYQANHEETPYHCLSPET